MKKLIYILMAFTLVFTIACNPMDDVYDEIGEAEEIIVGNAEIELSDDDYDALGYANGFEDVDDVKSDLPSYLADLYPVWGKGSSVLVSYKMADGLSNLPEVIELSEANSYRLVNSDYPRATDNAVGFFPEEDPADYMGDILTTNFPDAVEGDIVLTTYKKYIGEPVFGISNYFEETFNGSLGNFETVNVVGAKEWEDSSYQDDEFAKMSGYDGGAQENEDWLISPEVDLTNQSNLTFQVRQAINYAGGELGFLKILVSTDYTTATDPNAATWDEISFMNTPPGTNWTFVLSEEYDMAAYEGETIHIAFKFTSTTSVAATWEIDNAVIKTPGVEGETDGQGMYFKFVEGEWSPIDGVYYLTDADYDSMGTASGQPGKYNNFSNSTVPENYLPTFLTQKDPYAQEEQSLIVMYKYYAGGTYVTGNSYQVMDGSWTASTPVIQFGHDGTTWVPDNTIKYTLTNADYALTGDDKYGNYYVKGMTVEDALENEVIPNLNIVLKNNFPNAEEGQKFSCTYNIYDGGGGVWTTVVILDATGDYVLYE